MQKKIKFIIFFVTVYFYSFSQNEIEILQSDFLQNYKINEKKFDMFCGNVIAKYKDHKLYCDTIFISNDEKYILANSKKKSKITDSEGSTIQSKKIEFFKNDSIINFTTEVIFKNKKNEIHTNFLTYNPEKKIIYYKNGGNIIDEENIISSKNGFYHIKDEFGQFSEKVNIKTKSYNIDSENLDLDNKNDIIFLNSRSTIKSDDIIIKGDWGYIDKNEESINVWGNGIINNDKRNIFSDSIFINKNKETQLSGNIEVHEKENIKVYCQNLFEKNGYSEFRGNPKIIFFSQEGNITIEGEIIELNHNDSILSINNNTYISGDSIQGKCKNSIFNLKSEIICMMKKPVLWTEGNQISGDTIYLFTKNEMIDSIFIPNNSFIISKNTQNCYNQIKGNELQGKFKNGNIHNIKLNGNTLLKYFEKNKKNEITGLNDILCNKISILMKKNEINNISFKTQPEAIYTPKKMIEEKSKFLEGFINRFNERRY